MSKSVTKYIIAGLFIGVAVFLSSLYLVYNKGYEKGYYQGTIEGFEVYDRTVASCLNNEIKLLTHLRTGNHDAAINMLENYADNDISYLGIRRRTADAIDKKSIDAIIKAKEYRKKFPGHKTCKAFSNSVETAFQNISGM